MAEYSITWCWNARDMRRRTSTKKKKIQSKGLQIINLSGRIEFISIKSDEMRLCVRFDEYGVGNGRRIKIEVFFRAMLNSKCVTAAVCVRAYHVIMAEVLSRKWNIRKMLSLTLMWHADSVFFHVFHWVFIDFRRSQSSWNNFSVSPNWFSFLFISTNVKITDFHIWNETTPYANLHFFPNNIVAETCDKTNLLNTHIRMWTLSHS